MKYTKADLEENSRLYQENFKKMCEAVGTPEHIEYVKREEKLHHKDVEIRKSLGIYMCNPCPTGTSKSCEECTGCYKNRFLRYKKILKKGKKVKMYKMVNCQANAYGAILCNLKT